MQGTEVGPALSGGRFELLPLLLEFGEPGLKSIGLARAPLDRHTQSTQLAADLSGLAARDGDTVAPLLAECGAVDAG